MKQKNKKKKKAHIPFRLNMLFFLVFLLFSALILKLGLVQIVQGEDFKRQVNQTENKTVNNPVPRGKIFDRRERVVVDNVPLNAITYTRTLGVSQEDRLKTAELLATYMNKDTSKLTERDLKDFWMLLHPDKAKAKITDVEWKKFKKGDLVDKDLYNIQLDRITESDLNAITPQQREVAAIKREFDSGYALTSQIVKNKNVTPKEYAVVSEHLEDLPGVDIATDWERNYVFGDMFRSVLGNITNSDEGLPKENINYFLARDYNRNDRVGKSYIEQEYESVLHGQKAKVKNITDRSGNLLETVDLTKGEPGKDVVLTIDMELQKRVEKIIEEELVTMKGQSATNLLDRAFVVMMNPKTGEVLSLAGKMYTRSDQGKVQFEDFARGNFQTAYAMGSAVKGATVLTGYQTGAIHPNEYQQDETLYIKGTPEKSSWTTMGRISDLTALERSSNVYMFKTAIKIAGTEYRYKQPLDINSKAFDTMRYYFGQFGLGVKTGIDLPNEIIGWPGVDQLPGHLLDMAIGQYDTYTPLQMAQYVSTIANGGYRVKPQIIKEIRQPTEDKELGPIVKTFEPTILNRVDMKDSYVERVQQGFHLVMHGSQGTAKSYFANAPYDAAGKTGTAQSFYYNEKTKTLMPTWNLSLVGYAPFDNPEVAFAVVVPWAYQTENSPYPISNIIGRRIMDAYFDLQKEYAKGDTAQNNENQTLNDTSGQ
jgi:cell division protein FtsI/penicillin-binding protein 2